MKWLPMASAATLAALPCARLAAQLDVEPFPWAYAAALGGGVYQRSNGGTTKIYRGNFSVALRDTPEAAGSGPGVRLLLPVAVGFQELDEDLLTIDEATDTIGVASFLPGVELEHRLGDRWRLRSRAQLGRAEEFEGTEQSARVATLGVRSRVDFNSAWGKPALITGLLWTGFDPSVGPRDSLLRVTAAVELDIPAARWRVRDGAMSWRPHVLKDWFYRPPAALAYGDEDAEQRGAEWQVGVAAARDEGFKIWFMHFEAVGVAYRFSDQSNGLRIYINSVF